MRKSSTEIFDYILASIIKLTVLKGLFSKTDCVLDGSMF